MRHIRPLLSSYIHIFSVTERPLLSRSSLELRDAVVFLVISSTFCHLSFSLSLSSSTFLTISFFPREEQVFSWLAKKENDPPKTHGWLRATNKTTSVVGSPTRRGKLNGAISLGHDLRHAGSSKARMLDYHRAHSRITPAAEYDFGDPPIAYDATYKRKSSRNSMNFKPLFKFLSLSLCQQIIHEITRGWGGRDIGHRTTDATFYEIIRRFTKRNS